MGHGICESKSSLQVFPYAKNDKTIKKMSKTIISLHKEKNIQKNIYKNFKVQQKNFRRALE